MADELKVRDITVSTQPFFEASGQVSTRKVVQFFVGKHGPFINRYKPEEATAARVRADMDEEVQKLRIIEQATI